MSYKVCPGGFCHGGFCPKLMVCMSVLFITKQSRSSLLLEKISHWDVSQVHATHLTSWRSESSNSCLVVLDKLIKFDQSKADKGVADIRKCCKTQKSSALHALGLKKSCLLPIEIME